LARLVGFSRGYGVKNVAISTNGSADWEVYEELIEEGVTDFSVSLDACCASTAEVMAGTQDVFHKVTRNIAQMAEEVYTTIGVVITPANLQEVPRIVDLAIKLVVHDVRLITAAQWNKPLTIEVDPVALERFPILRYRLRNLAQRGFRAVSDSAVSASESGAGAPGPRAAARGLSILPLGSGRYGGHGGC
jgi:molybdenum cofactor biosynthesis enzyme MoaA